MQNQEKIQKIDLRKLNPHEEIIEENLKEVLNSLKLEKKLKEPILVDKETKVILDGHHRVQAFKILGIKEIDCKLLDYTSEEIEVTSRRANKITKEKVIEKGLSNNLFPPKTSKHKIKHN